MLTEMGYEREDAIYALRVTSNNLEHACQYLLNNPNPSRTSGSLGSGLSLGFANVFSRGGGGSSNNRSPPRNHSSNNSEPRSALTEELRMQQAQLMQEATRLETALNQIMMMS